MAQNGNQWKQGEGNTSRPVPSKFWCFTKNNYSKGDIGNLETILSSKKIQYVIGMEVGEKGTPHLQGFISSPTKIRPMECIKDKNIHWEKCKGTKKQNIEYCTKENNYVTNMKLQKKIKILSIEEMYPWQKKLIKRLQKEPDERSIYWYVDEEGGAGKTKICKYLAVKHKALVVNGGVKDILYGATTFIKENENIDDYIFILHLTRSTEQFVSYEGIESLKDGLWYNRKYESGMTIINNPHVIIFANFKPNTSKLTNDRWKIKILSEYNYST